MLFSGAFGAFLKPEQKYGFLLHICLYIYRLDEFWRGSINLLETIFTAIAKQPVSCKAAKLIQKGIPTIEANL